ncbi:MAG: hypothetical protein LAN61_10515 [Acidobacteriia bacterium]|nr:hypothetical protein [Terriglobia bacterium]
MSRQNRYRAVISWTHRKYGPQMEKTGAEATSIRRAINAALLSFFSNSNLRSAHADAHAEVRVHCWRLKKPTAL